MKIDKILVATTNEGKLKEFRFLLKDLGVEVLSLEDLPEKLNVEETGETFLDNAIQKARTYALHYKIPTIAEDSGLEIDALVGYPGVYSARFYSLKEFGGEEPVETTKDEANIKKVLRLMKDVEDRKARFVSVVVFYMPRDFGLWAEGYCYGEITQEPKGDKGFGYDPIFKPDGFDKTMAQMEPEEKNAISHRGKAVKKLINLLRKVLS
ncbi:MAG: RdgB/HAM1 family non-canonical purine NTP pyrophosphatase [Aquificae bacterium]|nr:RdgB/HAM1 family non-canonical purine NTP pyrophosphatase [Aquificota bacterium]